MENFKITSYIFFLFFYSTILHAQNKASGDRMYEDLAYTEVIKLYESKEKLSVEEMERIANGYRLNHDTQNAALWFGEVVLESYNPINFLYYAQALQSNGDFEKAKKYYLRYSELLGSEAADQRGVYLASAIDRMNEWGNDQDIVMKREDAINSEHLDFSPTFYKDGIVFVSSRKLTDTKKYKWTGEYFMNLYYAAANQEGELEDVQSFSKMINSKYHEGPVAFSKNYDRIFFTRNDHLNGKLKKNKKGVMKLGIFTALYQDGQWTEPKAISFNTREYEECHPALSADGKYLYFASDREGGHGGMDLYVSEFNAGKWEEPLNLGPKINTPGNDVFPFVHDDGTLYFASDGWGGLGGLDIFYTQKNETNNWTSATNMGQPYNSRKDDFGLILNVLGTEGYLNSSRLGGKGKDDIYSFKRKTFEETNKENKNALNEKSKNEKSEITIYQLTNNHYNELVVDKETALKILAENKAKIKDSNKLIILIDEDEIATVIDESNTPPVIINSQEEEALVEIINKEPLPTLDLMVKKKKIKAGEAFELKNLYYEFDKRDVNKKGRQELDRLVSFMKEYPKMKIELSAHTDSRGRDRYNTWLSRKRAQSARDYLIEHGISANRIIAKGYGETRLRNNCVDGVDCDERDHQRNRRTEVKIMKI